MPWAKLTTIDRVLVANHNSAIRAKRIHLRLCVHQISILFPWEINTFHSLGALYSPTLDRRQDYHGNLRATPTMTAATANDSSRRTAHIFHQIGETVGHVWELQFDPSITIFLAGVNSIILVSKFPTESLRNCNLLTCPEFFAVCIFATRMSTVMHERIANMKMWAVFFFWIKILYIFRSLSLGFSVDNGSTNSNYSNKRQQ